MSSYRILEDEVLSKAEFAQRAEVVQESSLESHPLAALRAPDPETEPAATQFEAIGIGKPLTILIRHVYTGKHPKSLIGGGREMCVVTGLKDYSVFAASSRAINFLQKDIRPRTHFKAPSTFTGGTSVVAYSPAVVTDSLHFTVEMAFDRFPDKLMGTISAALGSLAGIPLMVPAQGALLAASSVLKIGSDWADALIDGRASFSVTDTLDFNIPGVAQPRADFRVMCRADFDPSGFRYDPQRGLVAPGGTLYDGESPYVVVSLDGATRKSLEKFSATVATAEVLKQFFSMRDGAEASVEALLSAFKLANDLKFRDQAKELAASMEAEPDPAKKSGMQKRLDALKKNILSPELKL